MASLTKKQRERQPVLFTARQATNYARIVIKTHPITMHNEACRRTVINGEVDVKHRLALNRPVGVEPTTLTHCTTRSERNAAHS